LILGPEGECTRTVIRSFDDRCQAEAYLATESTEHRSFLESHVRELLERRRREKVPRFRLHPWNRYLAIAAACLLAGFQLLSLAALNWPPSLSPSRILVRKAQQEALALAGEKPSDSRPAGGESATEAASEQGSGDLSEPEAAPAGEVERGGREAGTSPELDAGGPYAGTGPPVNPSLEEGTGSGAEAERRPWMAIPKTEAGIGPALKGALGGGPGPSAQQGQVPAGAGEAGKAFLASPLLEYGSVAERIPADGGKRLAASSPTEPRGQPFLQAFFADFPALPSPVPGFDPAIERIQNRYMELLDERY